MNKKIEDAARSIFAAAALSLSLWAVAPTAHAYGVIETCEVTQVRVSANHDYLAIGCAEALTSDSSVPGTFRDDAWFDLVNNYAGRAKFAAFQSIAMAAFLSGKPLIVTADVALDAGGEPRVMLRNLAIANE